MSDKESKSNAPILIIVICAGFSMIVDTISSSIKIMGYDEVIQADAKARAAKILQTDKISPEIQARLDLLESQANENTLIIEVLLEDSHKPGS